MNKAKRIFNAMLLPKRGSGFGKGHFKPLSFGRSANEFHIDHLIPEKLILKNQPGGSEGNTIRNFAPLPSNNNISAKATSCSAKLNIGGIYQNYLASNTHPHHSYCKWLCNGHFKVFNTADFDRQELLEPNTQPDIGTQRVDFIAKLLLDRL